MRYFIHCDNNYKNFSKMKDKLKILEKDVDYEQLDNYTPNIVNFLYGFNYTKINRVVNSLHVKTIKRNPGEIIYLLSHVDVVILFHNFIEYNNGMEAIITACLENNIRLIVYSDHIKKGFLTNEGSDLVIKHTFSDPVTNNKKIIISDTQYTPYKFIPTTTFCDSSQNLRLSYQAVKDDVNHSILLR